MGTLLIFKGRKNNHLTKLFLKSWLILQNYPTQNKMPKTTQITLFKENFQMWFKQLRYIIKSYLIIHNNTLKHNDTVKHLTLKGTFKLQQYSCS